MQSAVFSWPIAPRSHPANGSPVTCAFPTQSLKTAQCHRRFPAAPQLSTPLSDSDEQPDDTTLARTRPFAFRRNAFRAAKNVLRENASGTDALCLAANGTKHSATVKRRFGFLHIDRRSGRRYTSTARKFFRQIIAPPPCPESCSPGGRSTPLSTGHCASFLLERPAFCRADNLHEAIDGASSFFRTLSGRVLLGHPAPIDCSSSFFRKTPEGPNTGSPGANQGKIEETWNTNPPGSNSSVKAHHKRSLEGIRTESPQRRHLKPEIATGSSGKTRKATQRLFTKRRIANPCYIRCKITGYGFSQT